jgi:hypothetical protein
MVAITLDDPLAMASRRSTRTRNGEGHIDRRHLVDDGQRRGVGRADEIPDFHVGGADPPREWRADAGIALLDLQIVQGGLVGLDGADQDIGLGLGVVDVDLGGGALADQVVEAPEVTLCAFELGLILRQHALGLLDLGVDLARIEGEQQIALVDPGAVFEMHGNDGGFQPRLERHARNRRHRPDRIDIDRHRLALGRGQFNRNHPRTLWALRAGAGPHPR